MVQPAAATAGKKQTQVRAVHSFASTPDTELSLAVGDVVQVIDTNPGSGWLMGKNASGKIGWFPENHVEQAGAALVKAEDVSVQLRALLGFVGWFCLVRPHRYKLVGLVGVLFFSFVTVPY